MGSWSSGSLQYPTGLCSVFEELPSLNALQIFIEVQWRGKVSITKEKKEVKIHFQLNFEKSMRQQNMEKLFQMARSYLRNFI